MKVFSGKCCMCDVGFPSGIKDFRTGDELYTGDIVLLCRLSKYRHRTLELPRYDNHCCRSVYQLHNRRRCS